MLMISNIVKNIESLASGEASANEKAGLFLIIYMIAASFYYVGLWAFLCAILISVSYYSSKPKSIQRTLVDIIGGLFVFYIIVFHMIPQIVQ